MKIVTVVQARKGSSRLPNKVLLPLVGEPLLLRMLERVSAASEVQEVVVATTDDSSDDEIESLCKAWGYPVYRGSSSDLLDRHYRVGERYQADAVVKIPSDCPLIDPNIIDRVYKFFIHQVPQYDYVGNLHPATYPDGNDVELMTMAALGRAWTEAMRPLEREHTTPYIWENPDLFKIGNVTWESGLNYSMSHRWTIDYEADYLFIKTVYEHLFPRNKTFGLVDILTLLANQPDIADINAKYAGVNWYRHHLDELKTVSVDETRFNS
ncbi:MAG: glycosyltransferase family protein [Chloroflexota bacterium]